MFVYLSVSSTFAMVDSQGVCIPVTVYNMNVTTGFMVGDSVAIPEPFLQQTDFTEDNKVTTKKNIVYIRLIK